MMSLVLLHTAPQVAPDLEAAVSESGLAVRLAPDADAALQLLADREAIVVGDLAEPAGPAALSHVKSSRPRTLVIGAVDPRRSSAAMEAVRRDLVVSVLPRPVKSRDLVAAVTRVRLAEGAEEGAIPAAPLVAWGIIGRSPRMRDVIQQIGRAGTASGGVLVEGERGTGRGLVAKAIHQCSRPVDAPFVSVYCDQVDLGQIERQLFGGDNGNGGAGSANGGARAGGNGDSAAVGSTHERVAPGSLLHRARGGTLYLQHIEELPDRVQARLAHVFRDGEGVLTDGGQPEVIDVRPMTAVGPGFQDELDQGRVRLDLYKRFAGTCISLPPLRDRREDIPDLAAHFVERACRHAGIAVKTLTPAAAAVLAALPWRGNARELQGLIELLVLKADDVEIGLEILLHHVRLDGTAVAGVPVRPASATLKDARDQFERDYISAVLTQHHGRIPDAARALGIQRTNLYRKLRTLHLPKTVKK